MELLGWIRDTSLATVVVAVLLFAGCSRDVPGEGGSPREPGLAAAQANGPPGFENPRGLCGALAQMGIPTRGWHGHEIDWHCASNYIDIGTFNGTYLPTNLAYYVTGDDADRAYEAKLVLNVNNPETKEQGLQRLADATQALVASTRWAVSGAFVADIAAGREVSQTDDQIHYSMTREENRIETYYVRLVDADVKKAKDEVRLAAIRASAEVFTACKNAIARDLSYPEAALSGDGAPIEGEEHRSFILKGREGDSFFCEVYPDDAYKIKAVFANELPFRVRRVRGALAREAASES